MLYYDKIYYYQFFSKPAYTTTYNDLYKMTIIKKNMIRCMLKNVGTNIIINIKILCHIIM